MRTCAALTTILLALGAPSLAAAQPKRDDKAAPTKPADDAKKPPADPKGGGKDVEMGDDDTGPIEDETGMEENPEPEKHGEAGPAIRKQAPAPPAEYPAEIAHRPITLHAGMS